MTRDKVPQMAAGTTGYRILPSRCRSTGSTGRRDMWCRWDLGVAGEEEPGSLEVGVPPL